MTVPIYQYYAEDPYRFMYSPNPEIGLGWTKIGVVFHGLSGNKGEPVYEYYAEDKKPYRFMYSRSPGIELGWINPEIRFYSLPGNFEGAIPVFEYYAENPSRFLYSSDPNIELGWKRQDVAFFMLPSDLTWNGETVSLDYDPIISPATSKVDVLVKKEWKNPSPATITETIVKTHTVNKSFEYGFNESIHVGTKTSFTAPLPLAEVSTTIEFDLGFEAHQTWKHETEDEYTITNQISLPGPAAIEVDAYIKCVEDLKTPFTLTIRLSAKADGGDLPSSQLMELLKLDGFEGEMEIHSETEVDCIFTGDFAGSYGIESVVDIREVPFK